MVLRLGLLICLASLSSGHARAEDAPIYRAEKLGKLLAAEKYCGLTYSEQKVGEYMYAQMQEEVSFAGWVNTTRYDQESMQATYTSPIKYAFCRQMTDLANKLGFL